MKIKALNYAELKEAYNNLLNEKANIIELKKENNKLKEIIKNQRKEIVELSLLVKVKMK